MDMFRKSAAQVIDLNQNEKPLRFGDLIAAVYGSCGKRRAKGMLRLLANAGLVEFRGPQRFVIY